MAHIAPTPAGSEDEGKWYVPVVGMGGGSIAGKGITALKAQWAETMRRLGLLPTTANVVEQAGGTNIGGQALPGVRAAWTSAEDLVKMPQSDSMHQLNSYIRYLNEGGREIKAHEFPSPFSEGYLATVGRPGMEGGAVPEKAVWDRVINSMGGMNDPQVQQMLGFGR